MAKPPLVLIEHGEIYAPEPRGTHSVLVGDSKVLKVGRVDRKALDNVGVEYDAIDATGCHVVPGLIDPHQHLLGGSGEGGLSLQTPMMFLSEIVRAGITTVVGTLGVDPTMKTIDRTSTRLNSSHANISYAVFCLKEKRRVRGENLH